MTSSLAIITDQSFNHADYMVARESSVRSFRLIDARVIERNVAHAQLLGQLQQSNREAS